MRSEGENQHNQWLLDIGVGNLPTVEGAPENAVRIPSDMIAQNDIVSEIFGTSPHQLSIDELSKRVVLSTTNKEVLQINRNIIEKIDGEGKIYYSSDSVVSEDPNDVNIYPVEFLNSQTPSGVPPHVLLLKSGTIVMLIRNLNPKKGLCNGTRMIVRELHQRFITCEIISESHRGDIVIIPRIDIAPSDSQLPFILKRRQFPIIPAFAITINKSQGQTFEHVGICLNEPVFSHGQLYVALSRSKVPRNIKIVIKKTSLQGQSVNSNEWFTQNVVFKQVFQN
jgi:ATP-dependent DNA helicase PIF1